MNASAALARESARDSDGKFGHQEHDRADGIDLYATDWAAEDQGGPETEPAWDPENVPGFAVETRGRTFTDRALTTRTPTDQWGEINERYPIATGITEVSCAGHGGIGLSRERNALIPAPLRDANGWYEEDCEYNIVVATFPREFQRGGNTFWTKKSEHEVEQYALGRLLEYFPEGYEKATGEEIPPGV